MLRSILLANTETLWIHHRSGYVSDFPVSIQMESKVISAPPTKASSLELCPPLCQGHFCGCDSTLFLLKVALRWVVPNCGRGCPDPRKSGLPKPGAAFGFTYCYMYVLITFSFTWKRELGNSRGFETVMSEVCVAPNSAPVMWQVAGTSSTRLGPDCFGVQIF